MRTYKTANRDQLLLMPPNLNDWIPANHPVRFVLDAMQMLDLKPFYAVYEAAKAGAPPYDPAIMLAVLLYGYMTGVTSSRKLERATINDVGFRYLTGNRRLDHDTIANFRSRHSAQLSDVFIQVVQMSLKAGIVRLGHVSIDGTKIRANANKWQRKTREQLISEKRRIEKYFKQCDEEDIAEDAEFGNGVNGYMLPEFMADAKARQQWIKETLKEIEAEAKEPEEDDDSSNGPKSPLKDKVEKIEKTLKALDRQEEEEKEGDPCGKLQRKRERRRGVSKINQTDVDARLMRFSNDRYDEAYNCQIAVDDWSGVIVAADVSKQAADQRHLRPMVLQVQSNTGWLPDNVTADSSYFNTEHIEDRHFSSIEFYVKPNNGNHAKKPGTKSAQMQERLSTEIGYRLYEARKTIVEPVFGMIKHARGFRQFLTRGQPLVKGEWMLWCTAHNMLKLLKEQSSLAPGVPT